MKTCYKINCRRYGSWRGKKQVDWDSIDVRNNV